MFYVKLKCTPLPRTIGVAPPYHSLPFPNPVLSTGFAPVLYGPHQLIASINLIGLALIVVFCLLIISLLFSLQWLVSFFGKRMKSPRPEICKSLIAISLHDTIQLHRIAVEKTYHVRFRERRDYFRWRMAFSQRPRFTAWQQGSMAKIPYLLLEVAL